MSADAIDIAVLSGVCVDLLYEFECVPVRLIVERYNLRVSVPINRLSARCLGCGVMLSGGELVWRRSGRHAFVWGIRRCAPVVVCHG